MVKNAGYFCENMLVTLTEEFSILMFFYKHVYLACLFCVFLTFHCYSGSIKTTKIFLYSFSLCHVATVKLAGSLPIFITLGWVQQFS